MRKILLLGGFGVLAAGALLIPNASGSAPLPTTNNQRFTAVVKQDDVATTNINVVCAPGDTTGTASGVEVLAQSSTGSGGNLGANNDKAKTIDVLDGDGNVIATLSATDTDTALSSTTLPCDGSDTWTFQPRRDGADVGTATTTGVNFTAVSS